MGSRLQRRNALVSCRKMGWRRQRSGKQRGVSDGVCSFPPQSKHEEVVEDYSLLALQVTGQPPDALRQPFRAGGEAPAQEAVAFGSEGAAGGEAQPCLADETLAEVEAVLDAFHAEEGVHGGRRRRDLDALDGGQLRA